MKTPMTVKWITSEKKINDGTWTIYSLMINDIEVLQVRNSIRFQEGRYWQIFATLFDANYMLLRLFGMDWDKNFNNADNAMRYVNKKIEKFCKNYLESTK